jgi:hypothetical protein
MRWDRDGSKTARVDLAWIIRGGLGQIQRKLLI